MVEAPGVEPGSESVSADGIYKFVSRFIVTVAAPTNGLRHDHPEVSFASGDRAPPETAVRCICAPFNAAEGKLAERRSATF